MLLKLSLVLATATLALSVAKREEGTLTEKLAYLARAIFGTNHPSLRHSATHFAY